MTKKFAALWSAAMRMRPVDLFLLLSLLIAVNYYANEWLGLSGAWMTVEKGLCVGLLALWAALQARSTDGWLIAAALALGAAGDVLLETHGFTIGGIAFLAGHLVAIALYLRNRTAPLALAGGVAVLTALAAWALPADRAAAPGVALYALGLGAMAGAALISRFPARTVGLGAVLFLVSDLLIFARMGPLADSILPSLLVWPTYIAAQALIAWGVARTLVREREAETGAAR
jgi:uncharacterized membrane protein YhhN